MVAQSMGLSLRKGILMPGASRQQADTAEVLRLCVSSEAGSTAVYGSLGTHSLSMLLYKGEGVRMLVI